MLIANREQRHTIRQLMHLAKNNVQLVERALKQAKDHHTGILDIELCKQIIATSS